MGELSQGRAQRSHGSGECHNVMDVPYVPICSICCSYWFGVPCVTLRNETEWVETVESGWNVLVGSDPNRIMNAVKGAQVGSRIQDAYGNGRGAERIVKPLSCM